jgi:hypothetical protein
MNDNVLELGQKYHQACSLRRKGNYGVAFWYFNGEFFDHRRQRSLYWQITAKFCPGRSFVCGQYRSTSWKRSAINSMTFMEDWAYNPTIYVPTPNHAFQNKLAQRFWRRKLTRWRHAAVESFCNIYLTLSTYRERAYFLGITRLDEDRRMFGSTVLPLFKLEPIFAQVKAHQSRDTWSHRNNLQVPAGNGFLFSSKRRFFVKTDSRSPTPGGDLINENEFLILNHWD